MECIAEGTIGEYQWRLFGGSIVVLNYIFCVEL